MSFTLQITFSCPLSQTVTKQISVSNPTDSTVYYLLSFVNNDNRVFTLSKPASILRLNAHGSGQVQIQFHAKKIQKSKGKIKGISDDFPARFHLGKSYYKVFHQIWIIFAVFRIWSNSIKHFCRQFERNPSRWIVSTFICNIEYSIYSTAYLLLCGRAVGPHFGRNQTVILEGHVDNLKIANEYVIRSKLYEVVDVNLRINVPYRNAVEYDIWMTEERPSHPCEIINKFVENVYAQNRIFLNINFKRNICTTANSLTLFWTSCCVLAQFNICIQCLIDKSGNKCFSHYNYQL